MSCHSIRRLTAAERRARDEREAVRYDELMAEIEAQERAEYEEQFGPTFRSLHAFKPSQNIHEKVERRIRAERAEAETERAHDEHQ